MGKDELSTGMRDVDHATDPGACVQYLDAVSAQAQAQTVKQRSFNLLGARVGAHLLDIGCGTGDDVRILA